MPPPPSPKPSIQGSSSSRLSITGGSLSAAADNQQARSRSLSHSSTNGSSRTGPSRPPTRPPAEPSTSSSTRSSFRVSRSAHGGRPSFSRTAPAPSSSRSAASCSASASAGISPLFFPSFDTPVPPSLRLSPYLDPATSPFLRPAADDPIAPRTMHRRRRSSTLSPPILQTPSSAGLSALSSSTSYFDAQHAPDAPTRPVGPLTLHLPTPPAPPDPAGRSGLEGLTVSLSLSPPGANGFKHHLLPSPVFVESAEGGFALALAVAQEEAGGPVRA